MNIPIVDIARCGLTVESEEKVSEADLFDIGKKLYEAFSSSGFAYVTNHGIPDEIIKDLNKVGEEFFSHSLEYKMKFASKSIGLCYDNYQSFQANLERPHDMNEGIRFPANMGDNEWPDVDNLKVRVTEMQRLCRILLMRVLKALGRAMRLSDKNLFAKSHELVGKDGNTSCFKFINYPALGPGVEILENQIRCGEHTDFGSLTFLFQDDIGGLQVKTLDGNFVDVRPIPGTMLVNVGEMLHYWSGQRLKATVHRVVNPTDESRKMKPRRSFVYFANVDNDVSLDELDFDDDLRKNGKHEAITSLELFNRLFAMKCHNNQKN
uniref:probable 2-oxoglutarate-dependent dioxygenase At3g50210 n=1 Tax=Styela clava TaxID=7725 RepID=UPI001939E208|nr:probable 2-oxoglutarate-dependent dioxygenase At3g50210 [Styela clava]